MIPQPTTTPAPVKRPKGRPLAHRPARISTRISQAAADHLLAYRTAHHLSQAAALETLILQVSFENNK